MTKRAGVVFLDAFAGSLATLLVTTTIVDLDSDVIPDAILLLEVILSAMIAGMIALLAFVRQQIDVSNGRDHAKNSE